MLELIPAIDIIEGKCVRLSKGDYNTKKVYNEDPVAVAYEFAQHGFKRLHLVDLDGAKSKHIVNHRVLHAIATTTDLTIDFGGGIKSDEDLRIAFDSGASMATVGSLAVTQPDVFLTWVHEFGKERMILGADAREGKVSINGWQEQSDVMLIDFLQSYWERGVTKVLCTDINRDGMLGGPAIELYQEIMAANNDCYLIASGGVSAMSDLKALYEAGIPAVVLGKAIYEGCIDLDTLALWNEQQTK
ncbi:MAG: 1-(5-phosphoribosyl)-5-[(5-phosphoribosylamino)methylideneamino]imidazole-4-carboxamide isomerase [Bacteroidales bacterium]|nr:1-(5-phosphoribosyl)-5-[(5-phosphoribosylamino)methylideneamino]imidazole-4-carboxamide isomerase [Bacteroidales bacterium]